VLTQKKTDIGFHVLVLLFSYEHFKVLKLFFIDDLHDFLSFIQIFFASVITQVSHPAPYLAFLSGLHSSMASRRTRSRKKSVGSSTWRLWGRIL